MSVRLNPAQAAAKEYSEIKGRVDGFNTSTPPSKAIEEWSNLEALKVRIEGIIQGNSQAIMALALAQKGIPTLKKRCEALVPGGSIQTTTTTPSIPSNSPVAQPVPTSVNNGPGPSTTSKVHTTTTIKLGETGKNGLTYLTASRPVRPTRRPSLPLDQLGINLTNRAAVPTTSQPSAPIVTEIKVKCNVPFGHALTIRGQGGDLDWGQGKALEKIDNETYVYRIEGVTGKVEYKILLDDAQWEGGANHFIEAEKSEEIAPSLAVPKVPIVVNFDGSGSKLFIRGTGPGMSWETGIELKSVAGKYVLEANTDSGDFEFKVLINDQQWSQGENFKAQNGKTVEITPRF